MKLLIWLKKLVVLKNSWTVVTADTRAQLFPGPEERLRLLCSAQTLPDSCLILVSVRSSVPRAQNILSVLSLSPVYSQPIICKAGADLLRSHFLPTLDKLRKKTVKVRA